MKLVVFWPSSGSVRTGLILPRLTGSITAAALFARRAKNDYLAVCNTLEFSAFRRFGSLLAGFQLIGLDAKDPWTPLLWLHALVPLERRQARAAPQPLLGPPHALDA